MEFYAMNFLLIVIFHIICTPKLSYALGCPDFHTIGPRTDDDKSMCAQVFMDATDSQATSCGGEYRDVYNDEETSDLGVIWGDAISSLIVREGCILTGWQHTNYLNDFKDFKEDHVNLDHEHIHLNDWDDEISSYVCHCDFEPVNCTATDEWVMLVSCDNNLDEDIMCKYHKSHGFMVGEDITNGYDYSATTSRSWGIELDAMFIKATYNNGDPTLTTGYSWESSKEFHESETEGIDIEFPVLAGKHVGVYQIQGFCGESVVRTECYQTRYMDTKEVIKTDCPDLP